MIQNEEQTIMLLAKRSLKVVIFPLVTLGGIYYFWIGQWTACFNSNYDEPQYVTNKEIESYFSSNNISFSPLLQIVEHFVRENPVYENDLYAAKGIRLFMVVNNEIFIPSQHYFVINGINQTGFYINPKTRRVRFSKSSRVFAFPFPSFNSKVLMDIPEWKRGPVPADINAE